MPVNESNCGRRPPGHFYSARNGHVLDTRRVNGTTMHRDGSTSSDGPRTIQPAQAATHNGVKPENKVNGYISHDFWSERTKTLYVSKKQDKKSNSNFRAEQPESNGSFSVNGARSLERPPLSTDLCDQMPAKLDPQPTSKSQRKKKKPWYYKRKEVARTENIAPPAPEDWENEIQEVHVKNWEKMTFGNQPFGPEDVVNFTLRDLSLERTKAPLWQVTSNKYIPAAHHRRPVDWFRYTPPTEPGQFSDVED